MAPDRRALDLRVFQLARHRNGVVCHSFERAFGEVVALRITDQNQRAAGSRLIDVGQHLVGECALIE